MNDRSSVSPKRRRTGGWGMAMAVQWQDITGGGGEPGGERGPP